MSLPGSATTQQTDLPPYIADQQLLLLSSEVANPRDLLSPEAFRSARLGEREADERTANPPTRYWSPVSRRELLFESDFARLCITTDAGIGKTTLLEWAEQAWAAYDRCVLALYVQLHQLPESSALYLRGGAAHEPGALVQVLCKGDEGLTPEAGEKLLRRLIRQQRLVLLVDGLDQTRSYKGRLENPKVAALINFLEHEGRSCRVVIAGRPHAVDRYWDDLFGRGEWRFAQLDHFTPEQTEQYLGTQRLSHLKNLDVEIVSIPRSLQAIRQLSPGQLHGLRTASDVYWKCVRAMLLKSPHIDREPGGRFSVDDALWLLGAMAYEMCLAGNFEGVAEGEFTDFKRQVWRRQYTEQKRWHGEPHTKWESFEQFEDKLNLLGETNEVLEFGFLEGWGLQQVFWRNRSFQEFFAGLWLARFASRADSRRMGRLPYHPDDKRTAALYWVWRFATEMPHDGRAMARWLESMKPLYRIRRAWMPPVRKHRPMEMIYRSWRNLDEARRSSRPDEVAAWGLYHERILRAFRDEFQKILGSLGPNTAADGVQNWLVQVANIARMLASLVRWRRRGVVRKLLGEFRPIPPTCQSDQDLKFTMGSPPNEPERFYDEGPYEDATLDGPFEMACYQVTNAQYELFDPAHRARRDKYSRGNDYPVIYVSWYDAFAFALWLGGEYGLPTEKQWEYACRAGTNTAFHYGNALSSRQANFHGHYPYGGAPAGPNLGRTARVGSYEPNAYGLYDMHGNVWEWCDTWYDEDLRVSDTPTFAGSRRVIRGGGWHDFAHLCRSALRNHYEPPARDRYAGFRLVRRVG